jgi:hypothetical protein
MSRPLTIHVLCRQWVILDSPEPLRDTDGDPCMALPDPEQFVVWIDPSVTPDERPQLLLDVTSRLWEYQLRSAPLVD